MVSAIEARLHCSNSESQLRRRILYCNLLLEHHNLLLQRLAVAQLGADDSQPTVEWLLQCR